MSNFHCLSHSHLILSNMEDVRLMNLFPTIYNMFLGGRLSLGDLVEVVAFVVVFSQSCSLASKTKACTLANMLVDNL